MRETPGITDNDVICAVTTLSFDIAVLELLAPVASGASIVLATEEEARDPRLLSELLAAHGVTLLQATPATFQMLEASGWQGNPQLRVLCGGEALPPNLASYLVPRVAEVWNMYGPTETTVWSTCHRLESALPPISVGRAIHNTSLYVLDEHRQRVPRGVEGQLYIGGDGVTLGYLHDEVLTARAFLPDPFVGPFVGRGRLYNTGDRARCDEQGRLLILGRSD